MISFSFHFTTCRCVYGHIKLIHMSNVLIGPFVLKMCVCFKAVEVDAKMI